MAEFAALPLYTDAYLGDTTHLTTFEHGAYLLLLIVAWRSPGGKLPDDNALLARYARMTRDKWGKTRPILEPFFRIRDGFWHQARLQDELQHLQSRRSQQIEAGHASARAKSLKRNNRGSTPVNSTLQRPVNETSTPFTLHPSPNLLEPNGSSPKQASDDEKLTVEEVVEAWNDNVAKPYGLPKCTKVTPSRRASIKARLRENDWDEVNAAIMAFKRSRFLQGEPSRDGRMFKPNIDWLMKPANFTKVAEGTYND